VEAVVLQTSEPLIVHDRRALALSFLAHSRIAYRLAVRILGREGSAEDIVQQAYLEVLQAGFSDAAPRQPRAWFLKIVANKAKDSLKSELRRKRREAAAGESRENLPGYRDELTRSMRQAIEGLEPDYRAALALCCEEGLTQREAAAILDIPKSTLSDRLKGGLEKLRTTLKNAGYPVSAAGVLVGLRHTAPASPVGLAARLEALLEGAISAKAAAGAGVTVVGGLVIGWKAFAWLSALFLAGLGAFGSWKWRAPKPAAAAAARSPEQPAKKLFAKGLLVTPRGWRASDVFVDLEKKGLRVVQLRPQPELIVPPEMRFRNVDGQSLVEGIARLRGLRVVWLRGGQLAVIQRGASEVEVKRALAGLKAADIRRRRKAALRAGWLDDVRVVRALAVAATNDLGKGVTQQARASLRRLGWDAVAALQPLAAQRLLEEELNNRDVSIRCLAASALGQFGGGGTVTTDKAWALFEKALADKHRKTREQAVAALGRIGSGKALAFVAIALEDKDPNVRREAALALGRIAGGKSAIAAKALTIIEKELEHRHSGRRWNAVKALKQVGGKRSLPFLRRAFRDQVGIVRETAISALGNVGNGESLRLIEKALESKNPRIRECAVFALGQARGEKALELLDKALKDKNVVVRMFAVTALGQIGGEKALKLIEKAMADNNNDSIRHRALWVLGQIGNEQALWLLNKAVDNKDPRIRAGAAAALGHVGGQESLPLLEKALNDKDVRVRESAVLALAWTGGDKTVALLGRALADKDPYLRSKAVGALGIVGSGRARDMLLARLPVEKNKAVLVSIHRVLKNSWAGAPAVEKATGVLNPPGRPGHKPQRASPPESDPPGFSSRMGG
jgi:RNA polymerase sigma factor (sigma-70 family)